MGQSDKRTGRQLYKEDQGSPFNGGAIDTWAWMRREHRLYEDLRVQHPGQKAQPMQRSWGKNRCGTLQSQKEGQCEGGTLQGEWGRPYLRRSFISQCDVQNGPAEMPTP